jgi:hypothetical protein
MIDTVREARILSSRGGVTKAEFLISRFKLRVRVLLSGDPAAQAVRFELDPDCKIPGKSVLSDVSGFLFFFFFLQHQQDMHICVYNVSFGEVCLRSAAVLVCASSWT